MAIVAALCDICGRVAAVSTCRLCGARSCQKCSSGGVCARCRAGRGGGRMGGKTLLAFVLALGLFASFANAASFVLYTGGDASIGNYTIKLLNISVLGKNVSFISVSIADGGQTSFEDIMTGSSHAWALDEDNEAVLGVEYVDEQGKEWARLNLSARARSENLTESNSTKARAARAIIGAYFRIMELKANGSFDTSPAENKLYEAQNAYREKDYEGALSLSADAERIARETAANQTANATSAANETAPVYVETVPEVSEPEKPNTALVIGIVVVACIVAFVITYFKILKKWQKKY
ncbi:MAG: hypothetical protein AB1468_01130 [Candidatus Micrarchaeota archaeon]